LISGAVVLINTVGFDGCEIINKSLNEESYFTKLNIFENDV
jgi:hypothetical protein